MSRDNSFFVLGYEVCVDKCVKDASCYFTKASSGRALFQKESSLGGNTRVLRLLFN